MAKGQKTSSKEPKKLNDANKKKLLGPKCLRQFETLKLRKNDPQ